MPDDIAGGDRRFIALYVVNLAPVKYISDNLNCFCQYAFSRHDYRHIHLRFMKRASLLAVNCYTSVCSLRFSK